MLATCRRLQRFFHATPTLRTLALLAITMPLAWLTEATAAPKAYVGLFKDNAIACLLYTSPSPRDGLLSRMPSSA